MVRAKGHGEVRIAMDISCRGPPVHRLIGGVVGLCFPLKYC